MGGASYAAHILTTGSLTISEVSELKYTYLCKRPSPSKGPRSNFDISVVCDVLHVTTHHAKFLHGGSQFEFT